MFSKILHTRSGSKILELWKDLDTLSIALELMTILDILELLYVLEFFENLEFCEIVDQCRHKGNLLKMIEHSEIKMLKFQISKKPRPHVLDCRVY